MGLLLLGARLRSSAVASLVCLASFLPCCFALLCVQVFFARRISAKSARWCVFERLGRCVCVVACSVLLGEHACVSVCRETWTVLLSSSAPCTRRLTASIARVSTSGPTSPRTYGFPYFVPQHSHTRTHLHTHSLVNILMETVSLCAATRAHQRGASHFQDA